MRIGARVSRASPCLLRCLRARGRRCRQRSPPAAADSGAAARVRRRARPRRLPGLPDRRVRASTSCSARFRRRLRSGPPARSAAAGAHRAAPARTRHGRRGLLPARAHLAARHAGPARVAPHSTCSTSSTCCRSAASTRTADQRSSISIAAGRCGSNRDAWRETLLRDLAPAERVRRLRLALVRVRERERATCRSTRSSRRRRAFARRAAHRVQASDLPRPRPGDDARAARARSALRRDEVLPRARTRSACWSRPGQAR